MEFERDIVGNLVTGLREMPQFLQIVIGPRQVGKTTAVRQAAARLDWPGVVASADTPLPPGAEWVESQWRLARVKEAACRLLRVHALRAADAMQLGAALAWADGSARGLVVHTLDRRLALAAEREGFAVVGAAPGT